MIPSICHLSEEADGVLAVSLIYAPSGLTYALLAIWPFAQLTIVSGTT
jgi:hypothetical protein